ncbi:hypothetical protein [Xanthomonas axonopodis]|uniref:hypothetical protein n=1 Tax=Xanthomonas axonopodis TaxID=53413 RepID=UPI001FD6A560|nr:hypothetical protein [Xanthomonas axonopodis]
MRDLALLLLLRGHQHLDLTLELGDACFQCLFLGRLRGRHARQYGGDEQGSRQRMAHQRCSTVFHAALSPMKASRLMAMLCGA